MAKRNHQFQTIRTEGAILPPDILRRIASLKVDGANAGAYHLPPGSKLNEAISQSWTLLLNHWRAFKEARERLPEDETGTAVTNEKWLLPLFKELDYGRLVSTKSPEIDERVYPIERFYNHTPIHLIGCNLPLDRRTKGARGAATASPHSMVQEYLNRSDEHLWAFMSNGLLLRILRDNVSLSRQAYVEFDLEAMMEGEVYADFALLWLLCHQSRVESDKPKECWLEKWSNLAREQGTRVLNDLRIGVQDAIEALGRGFIGHPRNDRLRDKLRSGDLSTEDYYRQLLRTVYRLLFLFVAEDRELLHPLDSDPEACRLYDTHYSTRRLRELALKIRGSKHADLWHSLSLVFDALDRNDGCPEIGLCGLGSFLWRSSSTVDLLGPGQVIDSANTESILITNDDLLQAVRALAYVEQDQTLRMVDYRNLGSEELGSVYESLLELHAVVNASASAFDLKTAAGNERKTTGSYYTPDSLVECLLDNALDPLIEVRLAKKKGKQAEDEILSLKVCDPACGSGHFLIAAAHRLARHLGRIRSGESEPSPADYQSALRDVIRRCIYGVDVNPMAVELCKVSLWMEAIDPGRPLTFLDHRIQQGNSLIGTTPALLRQGVPESAFTAIEGDVPACVSSLKKKNKEEHADARTGQHYLFTDGDAVESLPDAISQIEATQDNSVSDVQHQQALYDSLMGGDEFLRAQFVAHTWCAAFFWNKDKSTLGKSCPTQRDFAEQAKDTPLAVSVANEVHRLAQEYSFFHWHLRFPDVFSISDASAIGDEWHPGWDGGFDLVLGNPPWDTLSPDAKEFFEPYDPTIRSVKKSGQQAIIDRLTEDPDIANKYWLYRRRLFAFAHFLKNSGFFTLFAPGNLGKGDFDVYRVFVELALRTTRTGGYSSQVVKSGFYNGANAQAIRNELFSNWHLRLVLGFLNTGKKWFDIHAETRFALYSAMKGGGTQEIPAAFALTSPTELANALRELTVIPVDVVKKQSPDALAIPESRSGFDLRLSVKMYGAGPAFGDPDHAVPYRHFQREIDMGTDRDLFSDCGLPLFEGRMVSHFDYRAKAYKSGRGRSAIWDTLEFGNHDKAIMPQWHVAENDIPRKLGDRTRHYRVVWCDVATPTAPRSLVAALVPPGVICGDTTPTLKFPRNDEWAYMPWLAIANSFCMDYLVRKKITLHIKYTHLDSLPFPVLSSEDRITRVLGQLALKLSCTGIEMVDYWNRLAEMGWCGDVVGQDIPGLIDESDRQRARDSIDTLVASEIFDLTCEEFEFVLSSFDSLAKQEEKEHGSFVTKTRLVNLCHAYNEDPGRWIENVQELLT
ncbi:MAG: N-6 DNA methylase [Phycisphaerales bacterium]|nr:N-6 DNA methylase [Phycisphaerales bacterium]